MSDNMTPSDEGNALSEHTGVDALASLRQTKAPAEEVEEESEEVEAEASEEVEETDGEPDTSDESDVEDDGESDVEEAESQVEITLPSGDKITAEEAAKGYLRESDYTRKMQSGKAELQQKAAELEAQVAERVKAVESLYRDLEMLAPQEPNWDKIADEYGETEALKYQRNWDKRQKTIEKARNEIQQNHQRAIQQAHYKAKDYLSKGELVSEWTSPEAVDKGLAEITEHCEKIGMGQVIDVINTLPDPSLVAFAISALNAHAKQRKLDGAKIEAKTAVKKKPKPLKPGARNQVKTGQDRDKTQAINKFRQTQTLEDGMAAMRMLRKSAER